MKTALVTGGAGFVGSHLVDRLVEDRYKVVVVDDESAECNEQFYWRDDTHNFKVSINNRNAFNKIWQEHSPDYMFHLAAESRIQTTVSRPYDACDTNFTGTCNVLQGAKECGARVIYSSTAAAYGLNDPPQVETMRRSCLNPYSVSKVAAEDLCKMYYSLWGVETVIFRYFNVYGPRSPVNGQYAPVIGLFLDQKTRGKKMTIVGDGKQRRDYIHVNDIVNGNILAAESDNPEVLGSIFNLGSNTNHSVLELVKLLDGDHEFISPRLGEAKITLADNTKAREVLKWEPKIKLEEYIQTLNQSLQKV
jgi:UDP-glucose 4-epimerase